MYSVLWRGNPHPPSLRERERTCGKPRRKEGLQSDRAPARPDKIQVKRCTCLVPLLNENHPLSEGSAPNRFLIAPRGIFSLFRIGFLQQNFIDFLTKKIRRRQKRHHSIKELKFRAESSRAETMKLKLLIVVGLAIVGAEACWQYRDNVTCLHADAAGCRWCAEDTSDDSPTKKGTCYNLQTEKCCHEHSATYEAPVGAVCTINATCCASCEKGGCCPAGLSCCQGVCYDARKEEGLSCCPMTNQWDTSLCSPAICGAGDICCQGYQSTCCPADTFCCTDYHGSVSCCQTEEECQVGICVSKWTLTLTLTPPSP